MPKQLLGQFYTEQDLGRRDRYQLDKARRPLPALIKGDQFLTNGTAHLRRDNSAADQRNLIPSVPDLYPIHRCPLMPPSASSLNPVNGYGFGSSYNGVRHLLGQSSASRGQALLNSIKAHSEVPSAKMTTTRVCLID